MVFLVRARGATARQNSQAHYRNAVVKWAKEQGFEILEFTGKHVENSTSKNAGKEFNND